MARSQAEDGLEEKVRRIFSGRKQTLVDPALIRPPGAQFEVVLPDLAGYSAGERHDMLAALPPEESRTVKLTLAAMTGVLREEGIRAAADYKYGTIVVSSGPPVTSPAPPRGQFLSWAASPPGDIDMVTPVVTGRAVPARKPTAPNRPGAHRDRARTARRSGGRGRS